MSTYRRMKLNPYLISYTKLTKKWIKDKNVRPRTKKPEENIGQKFYTNGFGNDFLDMTPKAQKTKQK